MFIYDKETSNVWDVLSLYVCACTLTPCFNVSLCIFISCVHVCAVSEVISVFQLNIIMVCEMSQTHTHASRKRALAPPPVDLGTEP